MTTPDPVAYWLARLAAAERSADYARQQLAAARAREAPECHHHLSMTCLTYAGYVREHGLQLEETDG